MILTAGSGVGVGVGVGTGVIVGAGVFWGITVGVAVARKGIVARLHPKHNDTVIRYRIFRPVMQALYRMIDKMSMPGIEHVRD